MKTKVLFFAVLLGPVISWSANFEMNGEYTQVGSCQCEKYAKGNACVETPLAVHAFSTSSLAPERLRWVAETGETKVDADGTKKTIRIWLYPRSKKMGDEFRVGELDKLTYDIRTLSSGFGYTVVVHNDSRPQEPLVLNLEAPADQKGGDVDGPADYKTQFDANQFQHTNYSVYHDEGGTAGPGRPVPGNKHIMEFFRMKKSGVDSVVVTRIFDYQFASYGWGIPTTFNYGLHACALQKKN